MTDMQKPVYYYENTEGGHGMAANLGPLARELARDYRLLLPDLRNHGRSFHRPGMDYRSLSADVLALMDACEVGSAALVGHSMGGKVAMQAALDNPERVERLLVAAIAPVAYMPHQARLFAALREAGADGLADRRATQRILESHIAEPGVVALMLMNRAQREDRSWFWRFDLDAIERGYADILDAPGGNGPMRDRCCSSRASCRTTSCPPPANPRAHFSRGHG